LGDFLTPAGYVARIWLEEICDDFNGGNVLESSHQLKGWKENGNKILKFIC
jgi:hypothetical protein